MSRVIANLKTNDTIEEWLNKTNDLITLTASLVTIGDEELNEGNVVLDGNLDMTGRLKVSTIDTTGLDQTRINILRTPVIKSEESSALILYRQAEDSPVTDTRIEYQLDGTSKWKVGPNSSNIFEISNSEDEYSLDIETSAGQGLLTGTNLSIDDAILPNTITSNITGTSASAGKWSIPRIITFATGDVNGQFTLDGSSDIGNIVLTVKNNSHLHTIENITGLTERLDDKLNASDALQDISELTTNGVLIRKSNGSIITRTVLSGNGISVENPTGAVDNITISHADTSTQASVVNTAQTFVKNITLDDYGHITNIISETAILSKAYTSANLDLTAGDTGELSHSLDGQPKMIRAVLKCQFADVGYVTGDEIDISLSKVDSIVIYSTTSKIKYAVSNSGINVLTPTGATQSINLSKWKLTIFAWN